MALNIRNPEAERLASTVARLTGETKTEAVRRALADDLDEVALSCAALHVLDPRSADGILGYDEDGVGGSERTCRHPVRLSARYEQVFAVAGLAATDLPVGGAVSVAR